MEMLIESNISSISELDRVNIPNKFVHAQANVSGERYTGVANVTEFALCANLK